MCRYSAYSTFNLNDVEVVLKLFGKDNRGYLLRSGNVAIETSQ